MMSPTGVPQLADFGISHMITSTTDVFTSGGMKGTARWMAIEFYLGTIIGFTKAADVWAFGMTVYVRCRLIESAPKCLIFAIARRS